MRGMDNRAEIVTGFCQLDKVNIDDGTVRQAFCEPPDFEPGALAVNQTLHLTWRCYWMIHGVHRSTALRAAMALDRDVDYPYYIDFMLPFRSLGLGSPYIVRKLLFHSGKRETQLSTAHSY